MLLPTCVIVCPLHMSTQHPTDDRHNIDYGAIVMFQPGPSEFVSVTKSVKTVRTSTRDVLGASEVHAPKTLSVFTQPQPAFHRCVLTRSCSSI